MILFRWHRAVLQVASTLGTLAIIHQSAKHRFPRPLHEHKLWCRSGMSTSNRYAATAGISSKHSSRSSLNSAPNGFLAPPSSTGETKFFVPSPVATFTPSVQPNDDDTNAPATNGLLQAEERIAPPPRLFVPSVVEASLDSVDSVLAETHAFGGLNASRSETPVNGTADHALPSNGTASEYVIGKSVISDDALSTSMLEHAPVPEVDEVSTPETIALLPDSNGVADPLYEPAQDATTQDESSTAAEYYEEVRWFLFPDLC